MTVLWQSLGGATVQDVQQALPRSLAYTTVQTVLNVLVRKGKVKRVLEARAYRYQPKLNRAQVAAQVVTDMIDRLFGGSAEGLVLGLVETRRLTPQMLKRLKKKLENVDEGSK